MLNNCYSNFVRATTTQSAAPLRIPAAISGEEVKKIYLEEIKEAKNVKPITRLQEKPRKKVKLLENVSSKDLFTSAQNNDLDKLKDILDSFPEMLNKVDDYGWNLLMIACQANAAEIVEELLKRGIDTSVRDKGGNSARSLVIKNKNLALADIFLKYRNNEESKTTSESHNYNTNISIKMEPYECKICNNTYPDKEAHLSSTIHNISASKDKKIPTNYVIPQSNKGYQLMLRGGWDRDTGLGKDGRGKKYPLKTPQKLDRKGLGHDKKEHKEETNRSNFKFKHKTHISMERRKNRRIERIFRREFY